MGNSNHITRTIKNKNRSNKKTRRNISVKHSKSLCKNKSLCKIDYIPKPDKNITAVIDIDAVKHNIDFLLTMSVESYIIQIKEVGKGKGIGYNWKYITPRKMKIGVIPIGYADIIPRADSLKLYVYINKTKRRVLETISMDQIIVEAKDEDKINDKVYIFGNGKNCPQTIYEISKLADKYH